MPRFRSSQDNGFKNRAVISGIFITLLLMGYQNCGKVQKTPAPGNRKITALQNLSSGNNFKILEQEVLRQDPNFDPRSTIGELIEWKIDLSSKQIIKRYYQVPANDPLGAIATCTISQEWADTLSGLLAASQICHIEIENPPGQACTQVIEAEKHSSIKISSITYNLGYRSTACASYHDICDSGRDLYLVTLRDFILDFQSCTN